MVVVASLLPFWAVLGHNLLYITVGLAWLYFADAGATEEAVTMRQGHGAYVTKSLR